LYTSISPNCDDEFRYANGKAGRLSEWISGAIVTKAVSSPRRKSHNLLLLIHNFVKDDGKAAIKLQ
jgi:hypothetical protein